MLWYLPWSESIKKRACRYLLQRYLGNFLEEKLTLNQLSVDLYNGTGTVSDVSLDCEALNELGDSQNWPLEIIDGYMQEITVTIPWSTLLKDDSIVEVNGLSLTVQPKVRQDPVPSMLESMWSSMSSSMQLAAECLRDEDGPQESNPVEGIEMFAHTIDSILSRVKVKFVNTKIRLEHVPKNGDRGIALEIHIKKIDYLDEAGVEPTPDVTDPDKPKTYLVATYTNKKIRFEGVTLYTDEFPPKMRTMARSLVMEKSMSSQADKSDAAEDINYQSTSSDVFYETRSVISTIDSEHVKEVVPEIKTHVEIREATPEERASQSDPILFAKLTGQQELVVKIKHSEEVEGPKVEVKMLLGSLIVFISPRQLHTLIELVDAVNQPQLEDTSNIPLRSTNINVQCRPMRQADFKLIEAQLLGNLERHNSKPSNTKYGWSGPSLDDSDTDSEKFHPMTSPGSNMAESFSSSVSSMSTSMTSSVNVPMAQPRMKRNRKVPHIDGDPTAEVSHISFRVASMSCILLHKDILTTTPLGVECISPASASKLHEISKQFFDNLAPFTMVDGGKREFSMANNAIDNATDLDHLRLITSEVTIDGSDKTTSHGNQTVCEASIGRLLVRECLYSQDEHRKPMGFDLIRFKHTEDEDKKTTRANIKINFKQTSKYVRIAGEKKLANPTTDIVMKCMPFHVDVELTLIDRMAAIFYNSPAPTTGATSTTTPPQNQFSFSMQCPNLNATLRFPIADLRPSVNRDIRRIRPDCLAFKFQNVTIGSQQIPSPRPLPTTVTLKATTVDLYYHENDTLPATHIARTTMSDPMEGNILTGHTSVPPLPTISLTFKPSRNNKGPFDSILDDVPLEPAVSNPMTTSMYVMDKLQSSEPSPFSGKKMAHQSVTKHENDTQSQEEELIVPGSEEEMTEFTNSAIQHSSIHLEFNLPILSLQLESKQIYEIIYNRINSDLLLWEPHFFDPFEINPLMTQSIYPAFGECKGSGYDSESDSSSSDEENLYYSTYDSRMKKNFAANKQIHETKDTHDFCLTLKVSKGLLTIYAPVRDSNKLVVPGQMGELVLDARKLSMCQVSGLNGRPKTAQLCLRAGKTTLYHDSLITIPSEKPSLRLFGTNLPSHLKSTIYPSNKGVFVKDNIKNKDMFSLALKVAPDSETPNLKAICIALGIEQATLRHRGDKGIAWLTQLMDVIDVIDYPVPGYAPSTVLSELHVHVWDCAIDYRPLYLPIRSVVTLGNFSVSSNLIAETNTSCLRFLIQECTLFLSYIHNTKPHVLVPTDDDKHPDINKDYICVIDLGLFELSLRMNDKSNGTTEGPQIDLSASNNIVNLYTCWDSASALCRLLTYVASDGDCQPPFDPSSRHTSICSDQPLEQLVGLEDRNADEVREWSPSEIQNVHDVLAEAMKESPNTTLEEEDLNSSTEKEGVEVFFFPDESNTKQKQPEPQVEGESEPKSLEFHEFHVGVETGMEARPCNAHVVKDLGDPSSTPKGSPQKPKQRKHKSSGESNNTDDEYCIIDSQSVDEDDDLAEPKVTWFVYPPPPMIENYFSTPAARADVLQAPRSFPPPVTRYTLCEMSVAWTMYGGTDFKQTTDPSPAKKSVTIDDPRKQGSPSGSKRKKDYEPYDTSRTLSGGVSYSAGAERARAHTRAPPRRDLRERGGPARDHSTSIKICLSKVKFVHETYPSGGKHASRYTLAIQKVEVIDQLEISDINKMLSLYQLKDEPERKHAHMLVLKIVYLRPDPSMSAQECCMKVSLLPLRFNLDQDTLAFVVGYFSKLGTDETCDDDSKSVGGLSTDSSSSRQTTPTHRPPVMSIASHLRDPPPTPTSLGDADALSLNDTGERYKLVRNDEPLMEPYEAERMVSESLIQLEEDFQRLGASQEKPTAKPVDNEPIDDSPVYFRRVVFSPEVPIRLDCVGKRVDLSAGPVAGLLMGLGQLNCSELTLKRLDYRLGLLGLEKLVQWAMHEWLSDIKRHQLPGLLSGIGPMHSLLQLITGIRDLVWLPVEQWRRDGRLVHGLRRGAASFTARTAVAALDITTRILHLIQATAETAFDMLTPGPTLQLQAVYESRRRRRRRDPSRHPTDIREGVATAYQTMREGFAETAATMAMAARSESGVGVLRHLPGAAVTPLALAAAGAADVLGGVRAHLAPHRARDHADKYRRHPPDSAE